jgi:tetratricopeptide (TPR) repeat protein
MIRQFLLCAGLLFSTAAQAKWGEATSENFVVYGDLSKDRLVKYTAELEQFDQLLRTVTNAGTERNPTRVKVYLVSRGNDVRRLMNVRGSGIEGAYFATERGPFFIAPRSDSGGAFGLESDAILRHEYVHHFMLQNAPAYYPAWYREGFAEFYSTASFRDAKTAVIGKVIEGRLASFVYGTQISYRHLLSNDGKDKRVSAEHIYAQGWLMVHAMSGDKALAQRVQRYLVAINGGDAPAAAFEKVFGSEADQLDSQMSRYVKKNRFPGLQVTLKKPVSDGTIAYRELSPVEEAIIDWNIRFDQPLNAADSAKFARDYRAVAQRYPNDSAALLLLAEAENDAGFHDEALAAVDRLLAKDPKNARGLLRKGMILMDLAERAKADKAQWAAARGWIVKANRQNPDDPFILSQYYESYARAGVTPPKDATDGLVRAFQLVPQDRGLRLTTALELERLGCLQEAKIVVEPLAYAAHPEPKKDKAENDSDEQEERKRDDTARDLLQRLAEKITAG